MNFLINVTSISINFKLKLPQVSEKSLQRWIDQELEVMVNVHEVRSEYEKQSQVYGLSLYFLIR